MKKKLLSLLLAGVLAFGSVGCVSAEELGECEATISIDILQHYKQPTDRNGGNHPPLTMTVTIPEEYLDNALIGFYTEGQLTRLSKLEAASQEFTLTLTKEDGDGLLKTPDEIKIFVWNKGKLIPLTKSKGLLEPDETGCNLAIQNANYEMIRYFLKPFVDNGNSLTVTEFLSENYLSKEEDKDLVIKSLLNIMEKCANQAYSYKDTHLLTSEFGRRMFYDELLEVYELLQDEENKAQKDKLIDIWTSLINDGAKDKKDSLKLLFNFLRVDVDKFINGEGI